jgi:hypothetical protein
MILLLALWGIVREVKITMEKGFLMIEEARRDPKEVASLVVDFGPKILRHAR